MSAAEIAAVLLERQTFILTSHARPDGDAIGSQMALAFALRALGKDVRNVNRDPAPLAYRDFPGVDGMEIASLVRGEADAVVTLECSDLSRPGLDGLEPYIALPR
jgi:bifunctional oligoribonuclease and PAP phosphatase NrnA